MLSRSTDPSYNMLRSELAPVSILRDSLGSNKVCSNLAEQTIDNCNGTKLTSSMRSHELSSQLLMP